jgi:hypothetical protein
MHVSITNRLPSVRERYHAEFFAAGFAGLFSVPFCAFSPAGEAAAVEAAPSPVFPPESGPFLEPAPPEEPFLLSVT